MCKKILMQSPIYLLALFNLIYGILNGFNWLTVVSLILVVVSIVLNVFAEVLDGKDRKE